MRKFLIATHGALAAGIKSSLDIIIGPAENVFLIQAYLDENKTIEEELIEVLHQIEDEDELVIFTDLLGGSITNQIVTHALKSNIHIVSGFNLPLLIEVILADGDEPIVEIIESALTNAKDQLVYVNKLINQKKEEAKHD
ncbi:MAG: hypothetical protein JWQ25_2150 [Daejeonella sp.]|nr:hypothetical protein [Daejeonella sp.]